MTTYDATIVREGLGFGEAPRWHEGRLWYSDFYRQGVFSIAPDGSDERRELTLETQPSGLGWMPDGSLLVVSMVDQRVLRLVDGELRLHADIAEHCGFWANDMAVSASGVAYVGNFGFDLDVLLRERGVEGLLADPPPTTNVVVIAPDGSIIQVVGEFGFPNGTVITPDGATIIIAETMPFRLTAFDVAADGTLHNRRTFAQLDFVPADGICLDAEGQVWVANPLADEVIRVREGGEVTARVVTSQHTFACMLGGDDRRTLYVMTSPTSDRFELEGTTPARIEAARVDVAGAGLP
jgi:sugar lactone lactonase YvrE